MEMQESGTSRRAGAYRLRFATHDRVAGKHLNQPTRRTRSKGEETCVPALPVGCTKWHAARRHRWKIRSAQIQAGAHEAVPRSHCHTSFPPSDGPVVVLPRAHSDPTCDSALVLSATAWRACSFFERRPMLAAFLASPRRGEAYMDAPPPSGLGLHLRLLVALSWS